VWVYREGASDLAWEDRKGDSKMAPGGSDARSESSGISSNLRQRWEWEKGVLPVTKAIL
jgi:hypothetical protein